MFLGLRTTLYPAPDLEKSKRWFIDVLGKQPYFDQPFYVGFDVEGFELGLVPDATESTTYWGVADCREALDRLLELGATKHTDVQEVGDGIKVAAVTDPNGSTIGIIENPHFAAR